VEVIPLDLFTISPGALFPPPLSEGVAMPILPPTGGSSLVQAMKNPALGGAFASSLRSEGDSSIFVDEINNIND